MNACRARKALRVLACALGLIVGTASAQHLTLLPHAADVDAFKCLTRAAGALASVKYPERERLTREGGTVRVRMEFMDPNEGPRVEVLSSPSRAFSEAVRDYVERYRLPCISKVGQRATAVQEFVFHPRDAQSVTWIDPVAVDYKVGGCKAVGIEKTKFDRYPPAALRKEAEGRVLALATFTGPGVAAQVTILHGGSHRALDDAVKEALGLVHLECSTPEVQWPVQAIQLFAFQIDGNARSTLKDLDLKTFVAAIDQLGSHKVRFDLSSMNCPFEVEFELYQPFARNGVGQVGPPDPNRQAFLTWLQGVALRLPPKALDEVLGSSMRISVPCGLLDLTS